MPRKKNIFVLMGGKSSEHEISVISGREVVNNLNKNKYNVFPICISKDGNRWQLTSINSLNQIRNPIELKGTKKEIELVGKKEYLGIESIPLKPDIVFIAMHGPYGEDGTIQGMLDLMGLKYTGSGILASALGMDKLMFRKIMKNEKIPIPKYIAINKDSKIENVIKLVGKPPYLVKPHNQGSSVGTSIVKNLKELKLSLEKAWVYSPIALIDEYIKGIEVTCGVLGNSNPLSLPLVEIVPRKSDFFDYESKYLEGGSDEIIPARLSDKITKLIQEYAVKVHNILGCRGFSRVDFILKEKITPYVLEINTIPGLTPMSLFPKAAKNMGLSYSQLLDKIIEYANK